MLNNDQQAARLERQLHFLREIDKLKTVTRRNRLLDGSRRENAAEHSWHLAVMAMVLAELAPTASVDIGRVIKMLLIHDIVEIDAGDNFYYNNNGPEQHQREELAAQRLFGLLPPDQAQEFRALWDEFEAGQTPEAAFARAIDRFQPIYGNYLLGGGTWLEFGVTRTDIETRSGPLLARGSPALWEHCQALLDELTARGVLPQAPHTPAGRPGDGEPPCPASGQGPEAAQSP
ncbi:MAG: HD domain-containing protein [Limnochordales bacterium]